MTEESRRRILVAIDGSEPAERALVLATSLAQKTGASLDVVTVIDLGQVDVYDGFYLTDRQINEIQQRVHDAVVDKARVQVPAEVDASFRILRGSARKTLLEESERAGVDFLVLGRTGKGAWQRMVEGSVSRSLTVHAPVPVIVVP
ncbi:MAG: universal stress protein [Myxococcota bacterium]